MATSGDGVSPYQSGGTGGKFRKRPIRRRTPYDRPSIAVRNDRPSLFAKLVDPVSRLIYAGADMLFFGVFRKRFPSILAPRLPETDEEPRNGLQEAGPNNCCGVSGPSTDEGRNLASISAATGISDLENMLKQSTFTSYEIEHLTALLQSRTTESDVDERDTQNLPIKTSSLLRLESSTSIPLNKPVKERESLHAPISTPVVNARAIEDDVASPAELAKAYMGMRSSEVFSPTRRLGSQAPRQYSISHNNTPFLPRAAITPFASRTTGGFKGNENGLTTPRSRGRSAIYSMARTPYYRRPSTLGQWGISSDYGHGMGSPSCTSSPLALEHEGSIESSNMALKRRSPLLDDIGSGGPVRRIRQKANLLMQGSSLSKSTSELNSNAHQQPGVASQKLLLRNEPEQNTSKAVDENVVTSRRNLGYAPVPTKSTQMALKILEQLERLSPKEKPLGSRLAGTSEKSLIKLTSDTIHGQALGSLEKVHSPKLPSGSEDNKKQEGQHHQSLSDVHESISQRKDKVKEYGSRKYAVPRNVLSSMNSNLTASVRDNVPTVANTDSTLKLPAERSQKKQSTHEDCLALDGNSQLTGIVSTPLDENKKPAASVFGNNDVSADEPAKAVQTPALAEVSKVTGMPEFRKSDDTISLPKTNAGFSGQSGFNLPTPPPSKEPQVFPTVGTSTEEADKLSEIGSTNEPSGFKSNTSPGLFGSGKKFDHVQFSASNKDDNDKGEKPAIIVEKSESLSSASPTMSSASVMFSFGGLTKNDSITTGTSSSSLFIAGTNANSDSPSHVLSSGTTASSFTSTVSESSSLFPASAPAPIFSFGLASTSGTASTSFASVNPGGGLIGSTTKNRSQGSSFNAPSGIQPNTQMAPFKFGAATTSVAAGTTGIPSTTSGGSSAPTFSSTTCFGLNSSSSVFSSDIKSGSMSTTNAFSSAFSSTPSFGLGSSVAISETKTGTSTSSVFVSDSQTIKPFAGSETKSGTMFSFGASSISMPSTNTSSVMFGSSNAGPSSMFSYSATGATNSSVPPVQTGFGNPIPVFGSALASPSNTYQPSFGHISVGKPGVMFGSTTPTPSAVSFEGQMNQLQTQNPFQVSGSGQTNQPSSENRFQAPGSVEFSGGGSFSLGSGEGDKSGRRIVRVKRRNKKLQ